MQSFLLSPSRACFRGMVSSHHAGRGQDRALTSSLIHLQRPYAIFLVSTEREGRLDARGSCPCQTRNITGFLAVLIGQTLHL